MSYNKEYNYSYETVAASQSNQVLGGAGKAGDFLSSLLVVPATTSPGSITVTDGSNSAVTVFTGGATSVADLKPFLIDIGLKSTTGPWKVTTGAAVSLIARGDFAL